MVTVFRSNLSFAATVVLRLTAVIQDYNYIVIPLYNYTLSANDHINESNFVGERMGESYGLGDSYDWTIDQPRLLDA